MFFMNKKGLGWYSILLSLALGILLINISYSATTPAPQQVPVIGQVVWTKGSVKAIAGNLQRSLERRGSIYEHDIIMTDAAGSGEIAFTDGSIMTLREATTLKIDEYKYKQGAKPKEDKEIIALAKGGFRTITGAIGKNNPDGYAAKTPVATIGIRGTDFSVFFQTKLLVTINKGQIEVSNAAGRILLDPQHQVAAQITSIHSRAIPLKVVPAIFNTQPPITPAATPPVQMTTPPTGTSISTTDNASVTSTAAVAATTFTASDGSSSSPINKEKGVSGGGGGGGGGGGCSQPVKAGSPATGPATVNTVVNIN